MTQTTHKIPNKNFYILLSFLMRAMCPTYPVILDLVGH
jgi:hypothetical protein